MKRVPRECGIGGERLRSAKPDDWLTPAEQAVLAGLVDEAREAWAVDRSTPTRLDNVAPAAEIPARVFDDRALALSTTEKLVVSYRRQLATWAYATATNRSPAEVAVEFGTGHPSRPGTNDATYWLAGRSLVDGTSLWVM